jgi:S-adenosylmethionine:tRNA ribosyltransferase-isomerase
MSPAIAPPLRRDAVRLLSIDPRTGALVDHPFGDLATLLRAGDLLVVNDAATLPASLSGTGPDGAPIELRLVTRIDGARWRAVVFGAGDWHQRTEDRPAPPTLAVGDRLALGDVGATVGATVGAIDARSERLVDVRFDVQGPALVDAIYRHGRPVQYSHLRVDLDLWDVQTVYAARPWAVEMPSAGRPLTLGMLRQLADAGVRIATLTHAAGLSATGDDGLDAMLPLPERYDIPASTVAALEATRAEGGRVIAVGTTVVRALESSAAAHGGRVAAGEACATLVLGPGFVPRVVDGLLSGMHERTESHYRLLGAFAPAATLQAALEHAIASGYRTHEFGDTCLVLSGVDSNPSRL